MALTRKQLRQREKAGTIGPKQQARLDAMRAGTLQPKPGSKLKGKQKKLYQQEMAVQQDLAKQNIALLNPTQVNPFGQAGVTYDEQGNPVFTQSLSPEQQQILQQGQGLTQMGQQLAQQGLGGYQQFNFGDFNEQRGRVEDAVFGRLTKNLENDYSQTREAKEQELYNKGIPFSPDPGSRYQQELGAVDRRFDEAKESARNQAVAIGGQELQRQYGIDLGVHQQGMSDIGSLQQQGTGLQLPQFQQYQGQGLQITSPVQTHFALEELKQGKQALGLEQQKIGLQGQALAQANQPAPPPPAPSPFVT